MKTPIEEVNDNPTVSNLLQFSGGIIKKMDNKDLKGKQISHRWFSSLKWNRKRKEK